MALPSDRLMFLPQQPILFPQVQDGKVCADDSPWRVEGDGMGPETRLGA